MRGESSMLGPLCQKLFLHIPKVSRRRPPSTRPARRLCQKLILEALEDRTLLSTFTVTNTLDDGSAGSLRDAVRLANMGSGGDKIDFAAELSGQTVHVNA